MVNRAFDKIRQASAGMPAVLILLLSAVATIMQDTSSPQQRAILLRPAEMIYRTAQRSVTEADDLADIKARFETAVR